LRVTLREAMSETGRERADLTDCTPRLFPKRKKKKKKKKKTEVSHQEEDGKDIGDVDKPSG